MRLFLMRFNLYFRIEVIRSTMSPSQSVLRFSLKNRDAPPFYYISVATRQVGITFALTPNEEGSLPGI